MSQQQRKRVTNMMDWDSLNEWAKDKPLSILQLDPADRAVLKIAGECVLDSLSQMIIIIIVTEQRHHCAGSIGFRYRGNE